jgi:FdrA protein
LTVRARVLKSFYQDSMALMHLANQLRALPGVRETAALMGTPANHELLASAGLATPESRGASAGDLILAIAAEDDASAEAAFAAATRLFEERQRAREATGRALPRTLDSAVRQVPDANLVMISVPGPHAKLEALTALRRGLHVFLFSDNVSVADEIELKQLAVREQLLCMGPDCGTAYVNGVGLGFANVVPRGRIGCVAASGTGLQAVVSRVAALGEGISHGLGVGGRDLSAEVGGAMTLLALDALARDPSTACIVIISKPPAPSVLPSLQRAIGAIAKPVIVCCLGATPNGASAGTWVTTLDDAAHAAVAAVRGQTWRATLFSDPARVEARLTAGTRRSDRGDARGGLLALYTGGTLAHEARLVLEPLIGPVAGNVGGAATGPHRVTDLGADEFTRGRPHPMIDPSVRDVLVREAGRTGDVGVLLLDLVLGRAAHPDPAGSLAVAIRAARADAERDGRTLHVVASVVGTDADPQNRAAQIAALEAAGVDVLPSNAQAARFAALRLDPALAQKLPGDA